MADLDFELGNLVDPQMPKISGELGIPLNGTKVVDVGGRPGYVYVRVRNTQNEVVQAHNEKVSPTYGLPVEIEFDGKKWEVLGRDTDRYINWGSTSSFLPAHGNSHSMMEGTGGGGDPVWVDSRQILPMLGFPSGSSGGPNLVLYPYLLRKSDNSWAYIGNTGTPSFSGPSGSFSRMYLMIQDTTSGGFYFLTGTPFAITVTGTAALIPFMPRLDNPNNLPITFIRAPSGTSSIGWDNLIDARQFFTSTPTGTGGGSIVDGDYGDIQVSGTSWRLHARGDFDQTTTAAGVYAGIVAGTPRILFANGTAAQNWQIDNSNGEFRWYLPGVEQMVLTSTELDVKSKPIINVSDPTNPNDAVTQHYLEIFAAVGSYSSGTNTGDQIIPALPASANLLNNGGFSLLRRQAHTLPSTGTSYSDDTYCFDRWYALTQTASVQFLQTSGDNNQYACQIKQNQASAQRFGMAQIMPAGKSINLRGQTVNFQVRIKSSSTPAMRVAILEWTGTADSVTSDVVNNWTNGTFTAGQFFKSTTMTVVGVSSTANASSSYANFSVSGSISTSCNNLIVMVWAENTVAQNVTVDITKAGLYPGATVVQVWQEKELSQELADAQFYLHVWAQPSTNLARLPFGSAISTTACIVGFSMPMRTQPTISISGTISLFSTTTSTITAVSSVSIAATNDTYGSWNATFTTASGLTAGQSYFPVTNSINAYIWIECEL